MINLSEIDHNSTMFFFPDASKPQCTLEGQREANLICTLAGSFYHLRMSALNSLTQKPMENSPMGLRCLPEGHYRVLPKKYGLYFYFCFDKVLQSNHIRQLLN